VFVGDSTYDVLAAQAAGVPVIVAGYGYCESRRMNSARMR
jgi:phosphoglycolate phosphatase